MGTLEFGLMVKEAMSFKVVHTFKSCSHFSVSYHMCIFDRGNYRLLLNLGHLTDLDPIQKFDTQIVFLKISNHARSF